MAQSNRKPPIAPLWVYSPWIWEDSLNTDQAVKMLVNQYKQHKIPVGALIVDSPWSLSYNDFLWDTNKYPDPKGTIKFLKDQNIKVVMWLTACINSKSKDTRNNASPDFEYVRKMGYAVNNGQESDWWKGRGLHIDFTNPAANKWWNTRLDKLLDMGIDGWKVDQGEIYFGDTVTTSIGKMSNEAFRPYYYRAIINHSLSKNRNAVILGRPFSHQGGYAAAVEDLTVGWSGDFSGNWGGLNKQINNIYTSANAGYGTLACEIGGYFEAKSKREEFIRYMQFGSFCPVMINGGSNGAFSTHLPWYFGEDVTQIYRYYATLHQELGYYLFSAGVNAHVHGGSIIKNASIADQSHLLGEDIFVKPITGENATVAINLPENNAWFDYWTDSFYEAGQKIAKTYSEKSYPIFIKAGAIIPLKVDDNVTGHGDGRSKGKQTFLIYPYGNSSTTYHKPTGDGVSYQDIKVSVNKNGTIDFESVQKEDCIFLIKSKKKPVNISNAKEWSYDEKTNTIRIIQSGKKFSFSYH